MADNSTCSTQPPGLRDLEDKLLTRVGLIASGALVPLPQAFSVKLNPVRDTADHGSDMDKVKVVLAECPVVVGVVDLETAVGWDEIWLNRR